MDILMTSSGGVVRGLEGWYEHGLAKQLVKMGHDVTVFSSSNVSRYHDAKPQETISGIKVRRFNPINPLSMLSIARGSWDIVHMHHLGYLAPISSYAAVARKLRSFPSVFNVTGLYHDPYIVSSTDDPFSHPRQGKMQRSFPLAPWRIANWFVHKPLFECDTVLAMTNWEKAELARFGIKNAEVAPLGISLEAYRKKRKGFFARRGIRGPVLLFVGQPTMRKGWQYLLAAMPHVLEKFPDAKAVFIGYRSDPQMERMVSDLQLQKNVVMLGYLSDQDKAWAMQSADVFVLPTLYEGFGMVFLEAMASSLPIVTTDVAGNSEIVRPGRNGLLAKAKDEKSLASCIARLLSSKSLRNRMARSSLADARQYEWKEVAKRYFEVYEKAIESHTRSRQ